MSGTTHTRTSISNINTMICRMYSSGTSTIHLPSCPFKSYMIQLDGSWNFSIYSWPKVIPVIEQFSLDSLGAVVVEMYLSFQLAVAVAWHVFLWWWKKFISDVCHQWFETWQPTLNSQQFKVRVSAFPTIYSLFFCRFSTRFFLRCVTLTSTLSGSSPQSHDAFALSRLPGFPDTGCPDRTLFCGWVGRVAWIQNTNRKSSLANLASLVDQYGNRFIYHSYIIICYDLMNLKWWRDSLQSVDMHSHTHTHVWHYSSKVKTNRNHTLVDKYLDACECISMCIHWIRTIYTRCLMMFASFILNRSQLFCFLLSASCCRKSQHHFMAKTRQPLKNHGYSRMIRVDS